MFEEYKRQERFYNIQPYKALEIPEGIVMIERTPVSSSNISSIGYDSQQQILEIAFHNRSVYRHFGVPEHLYEELMNADSHGRYYDRYIKKGGYRYEHIE